jgi:transcriptional regulator with XRE-family HTH domain
VKIFCERLKELRELKGLTQEEFGKKIGGLSKQTISNYESETRSPALKFIIKTSKHFNVSTDYLLGITNEKPFIDYKVDMQNELNEAINEFQNKIKSILT